MDSIRFSCSNLRGSSSGWSQLLCGKSGKEEQAAHSDPSTTLCRPGQESANVSERPLHWPTSTPMRAGFSTSRRSLELCIPNWLLRRRAHLVRSTLLCPYVQRIAYIGCCTCFHMQLSSFGGREKGKKREKKKKKNNSIVSRNPADWITACTRSAFNAI